MVNISTNAHLGKGIHVHLSSSHQYFLNSTAPSLVVKDTRKRKHEQITIAGEEKDANIEEFEEQFWKEIPSRFHFYLFKDYAFCFQIYGRTLTYYEGIK
jgi:hypothetical protein